MEIITLPIMLRWLGALLLTLTLMLLAIYLMQTGKDKLRQNAPTRRLKLLESLSLSRTTTLHLVQAEGHTFLATTDANGTQLTRLKEKRHENQQDKPITRTPKV